MKTVNIGKLKNNLSSYLREVRNGEEVIVQDRKKPIARISPIAHPAPAEDDYEAEMAHRVATGRIKPAQETMDWEAFNKLPRPEGAVKEALDL